MIKIWYYKRQTRKLRKKAGLPELYDKDDLPDPIFDPNYVRVLTDKQQYELHHRESLCPRWCRFADLLSIFRAKTVHEVPNMVSSPWNGNA
jgi:hypothetical protein